MQKIQQTRTFTGKTDNFSDPQERHFFQRMLRAYLKGAEFFYFGFKWIGSGRQRQQWKVMQEWV